MQGYQGMFPRNPLYYENWAKNAAIYKVFSRKFRNVRYLAGVKHLKNYTFVTNTPQKWFSLVVFCFFLLLSYFFLCSLTESILTEAKLLYSADNYWTKWIPENKRPIPNFTVFIWSLDHVTCARISFLIPPSSCQCHTFSEVC